MTVRAGVVPTGHVRGGGVATSRVRRLLAAVLVLLSCLAPVVLGPVVLGPTALAQGTG